MTNRIEKLNKVRTFCSCIYTNSTYFPLMQAKGIYSVAKRIAIETIPVLLEPSALRLAIKHK